MATTELATRRASPSCFPRRLTFVSSAGASKAKAVPGSRGELDLASRPAKDRMVHGGPREFAIGSARHVMAVSVLTEVAESPFVRRGD